MSYIGREPQIGNFQVCDAISTVNNQAAYTMQVGGVNVSPETANHMLVSLNGILQAPTTSYTVSGSTITFAANLVTGDVINFIQILGSVLDLGVPSDNTVTTAKLSSTSVTAAKLNNDIITGQTAETSIADGDTILIHDASASALRKMTKANFVSGIGGANTPAFQVLFNANQSIAVNTNTVLAFNTEIFDTDNAVSSGVFTVPSDKAGKYFFTVNGGIATGADVGFVNIWLSKNSQTTIATTSGNAIAIEFHHMGSTGSSNQIQSLSGTFDLSVGDTIRVYLLHNADSARNTAVKGKFTFSGHKLIT